MVMSMPARTSGSRDIDRNNLTVIETKSHAYLPAYLAEHEVEIVASPLCYLEDCVDNQRGNAAGHGTRLPLTLV